MKRMIQWGLTLFCVLTVFASCSKSDDNPVSLPVPVPASQSKLVTLPKGVVSKGYIMQTARIVNTIDGGVTVYEKKNVQVAFDGQDVYVSGFSTSFPESFVKGTLSDAGTCQFKSGQYVGKSEAGEKYVVGIMGTGDKSNQLTDFECAYDAEMRILTIPAERATCAVAESVSPSHAEVSNILKSVTVMPGSFEEPAVLTLPEGLATEQWYVTGATNDDSGLNYALTVAFDGQDVYMQGLFRELPLTWLHGRLENGVITFEKGQFLGYYKNWQEVSFLVDNDDGKISDLKLSYDAEKGVMTSDDVACMYDLDKKNLAYAFYYIYITKKRYVVPALTVPPAGVAIKTYRFTYKDIDLDAEEEVTDDTEIIDEAQFALDGSDVYLKLLTVDANGWAKGTLSPDGKTITIPSFHYIGTWSKQGAREDYYLTAFVENGTHYEPADIVLSYNAQDGSIRGNQLICVTRSYRMVMLFAGSVFGDVAFTEKKEVPATPAAPEVDLNFNKLRNFLVVNLNIPLVADNGADLLAEKLSYKLWYEKDGQPHELVFRATEQKDLDTDMVEFPYFFAAGEEFIRRGAHIEVHRPFSELLSWTKVGAQTIYRGGGEEHASAITWYDADSYYRENDLIK